MKRATIPFLTAVLLLGLLASTVHAKSAAELLREGLYAEEVEGNLDTAIGIYQQIILDTTAPKNLVAQALYRQGMCFMKKKDEAKAREVFQKLVTDYTDQTEVVEKAKPVLEGLGNADPASLMPPETIAVRRDRQPRPAGRDDPEDAQGHAARKPLQRHRHERRPAEPAAGRSSGGTTRTRSRCSTPC